MKVANRFISHAGMRQAYTKADVQGYLDSLIEQGLLRQSINAYLAALRAFFAANELVYPTAARDLHFGMAQVEPNAPVLPIVVVQALIRGIAPGQGIGPRAVALASMYGLRPSEIAATITEGCDGSTISVQTRKQGRRRVHTVPPALRAVLTFEGHKVTTDGLHKLFDRCMAYIRRPSEPGEGWHAVRRTLVTGLLENGVSEYDVERWMGWRQVKKTSFTYYRPNPTDLDERVYAAHPFLPVWQEIEEMVQLRRVRG
jgi:integrase